MSYNLLKGKKGIIFGALDESSIAWIAAERAKEEGAEIMLTNVPVALRMGKINELADKIGAKIVPADATSEEDLENLMNEAEKEFGKIDFILHSIGMSVNVRKKREYTNLNYKFLDKTYDISAISFHKVMQMAMKKDIMNEWGSIVALTFIAAQRTFPKYSDMAESKALLESIARSFGYYFGKEKHVRVNTISQSPTVTTAGGGINGFMKMFKYGEKVSPLGNAPALDCANYILTMFSDFTKMVTMQNLFHDGGFSSTGVSEEVLDCFSEEEG